MLVPTKRAIAEALLERGSVFVHLDPRHETVHVPVFLRKQPQVVLQVGLDMPVPIPDLAIDDEGVTATLSFNRTPHRCFVPWDAVFALVGDDGRGRVFIESMPTEIKREIDREASGRDQERDREPTSEELDAMEGVDGAAEPAAPLDGNVIPLWPRSVKPSGPVAPIGVVGPVGGKRPATLPPPLDPSPSLSVRPARPRADTPDPRDPNKPRPPHPHLRRIK